MLMITAKEKTMKEKKGIWSRLCMQSGIENLNKGPMRRWILSNDLKEVIELAMQESGGKKCQAEKQQVERSWGWSMSGMFEEEWGGCYVFVLFFF